MNGYNTEDDGKRKKKQNIAVYNYYIYEYNSDIYERFWDWIWIGGNTKFGRYNKL